MPKCVSCRNFDRRNSYCPVIDRDVSPSCISCEYYSHWHSLFEEEELL